MKKQKAEKLHCQFAHASKERRFQLLGDSAAKIKNFLNFEWLLKRLPILPEIGTKLKCLLCSNPDVKRKFKVNMA